MWAGDAAAVSGCARGRRCVGRRRIVARRLRGEERATAFELFATIGFRHEAVMTDAMEAVGQHVQQKTANELVRMEAHHFGLAVAAIILVAEGDLGLIDCDEAGVGDRRAVGIAGEIGQNLRRPAERRLGVDDPFAAPQGGDPRGEDAGLGEPCEIAEKAEAAIVESRFEAGEE